MTLKTPPKSEEDSWRTHYRIFMLKSPLFFFSCYKVILIVWKIGCLKFKLMFVFIKLKKAPKIILVSPKPLLYMFRGGEGGLYCDFKFLAPFNLLFCYVCIWE